MQSAKKNKHPRWFWLKQPAIYPPSIVLFFSLFGLIYLLNKEKNSTMDGG